MVYMINCIFESGYSLLLLWIAVYDQKTQCISRLALYSLLILLIFEQLLQFWQGSVTGEQLVVRIGMSLLFYFGFLLVSVLTKQQFGMGDVKLIGILALHYEVGIYVSILLTAFFLCNLYAIFGILVRRWKRRDTIAFVPFLTGSILIQMLI